jgi:phosphoribosylaminoimidazole-succinocarboxamide synthase
MTDEFINSVSERYIELYEQVTGDTFERTRTENILNRIENNINNFLKENIDTV